MRYLQIILLVSVLFLTGCVGVIPIPFYSNNPPGGVKLKSKNVAFIQVNKTTTTDVFNTIGTNYLCDPYQRAVAYSWETRGGKGIKWYWWLNFVEADEFEWGGWKSYMVAFDTNNIVVAKDWVNLRDQDKSLHDHLEKWAKKHHAGQGGIKRNL